MAATAMSSITITTGVTARVAQSSKVAALAPKVASAPGMQRVVALVCEARNGAPNAAEQAMSAVRNVELPAAMRPALATAVANVLMASPANAGVLFDFNLTLPIIMGQFLVLMFILDKVVFAPVGDVLEKRDGLIRDQLQSLKDGQNEEAELIAQANSIVKSAMMETKEEEAENEKKVLEEGAVKVAAARAQLDREMAIANEQLKTSKAAAETSMADQVEAISDKIVAKVLEVDVAAPVSA